MLYLSINLIFMLLTILVAAELFTNGLEHAGQKLGISEGVTGSLFAAIATALPETTVPILAIIAGTANQSVNEEVSVGAILGAPLMLSTLSIFLMSMVALKKRGLRSYLKPERKGLRRDLHFFLAAFFLAGLAMYAPAGIFPWRMLISVILVGLYGLYIMLTLKASKQLVMEGNGVHADRRLMFSAIGLKNNAWGIGIQLLVGLALLLFGAKGFIHDIEGLSAALRISPLLLALLIIPIATELPEKVNSMLWIARGKDTLAFGNITGAMVFQGTLLPALGIWLTPWQSNPEVLISIVVTALAALWLRIGSRKQGVPIWIFLGNGILYLLYLIFVIF